MNHVIHLTHVDIFLLYGSLNVLGQLAHCDVRFVDDPGYGYSSCLLSFLSKR